MARNRWRKGDWLVIDEESGFTEYASNIQEDWRGALVNKRYADDEHPQDFIYSLDDPKVLPYTSLPDRNFDVTANYPQYVGLTNIPTNTFGAAYHLYAVSAP